MNPLDCSFDLNGERNGNGCSFAFFAVNSNLRVEIGRRVLDNGKSQTRSAGLLRMALVYSVEAFKDALPVLRRDSDAGIGDLQYAAAVGFSHFYGYYAAGDIVFYGIFRQVVDDLMEQSGDSVEDAAFRVKLHVHAVFVSGVTELLCGFCCDVT